MTKKYISLFKSGKFYNAFGDDGIIIHFLLGYKYTEYKHSVGFPESAYNKVINKLQMEKISYKVFQKENLLDEYKGVSGVYTMLLKNGLKHFDMEKRVERLKENIESLSLDELEKIVERLEDASVL